jgi:hypothetical protein
LPRPIRASHLETVESATPSTSAISAAVIRSRRSASIASRRSDGRREGTRLGAELRSSRPTSPSERQRLNHLRALRSLMPAASAATISDQFSSSIRSTSSLRLFGQVRALAWIFIRCPP